jgi:hypothetical protein
MDEHDKARPVSGEIMTGDPGRASISARQDFTDAEIVSVEPARRDSPTALPPAHPEGMDFLKAPAVPARDERTQTHGGPLFWAVGLAMVGLAFWVSGGHALVRQTMSIAATEPGEALRIGEVKTRVEDHSGRSVLFVEGEARNHGDVPEAMRPIEIFVIDNDGRTTRYFLGTRAPELAPGSHYSFSSRIEAPRNGVKSVSVSFQEGVR